MESVRHTLWHSNTCDGLVGRETACTRVQHHKITRTAMFIKNEAKQKASIAIELRALSAVPRGGVWREHEFATPLVRRQMVHIFSPLDQVVTHNPVNPRGCGLVACTLAEARAVNEA